jgi:NTE family protein
MAADVSIPREADGVFEGGGVKGIALVGGVAGAEEAGLEGWKNVAGTSAGAIVACLLAAGYDSAGLKKILEDAIYSRFADYGPLGKVQGWVFNQFRMRGLAPGSYFMSWLGDQLKASPLAEKLGKTDGDLSFADVVRDDLPPGLAPADVERARYRLRVIASDISAARMLVLPQDIVGYYKRDGTPYDADSLRLVEAVRMSMSYPYLFRPHVLYDSDRKPHYIVDGGLLSNFPVWLFDRHDGKPPARPTWAFRLHGGTADEPGPEYHGVPMPFWRLKLAKAMFQAATEAWDQRLVTESASTRTVNIPTFDIKTTDFALKAPKPEQLFQSGLEHAQRFYARPEIREYVRQFGVAAPA